MNIFATKKFEDKLNSLETTNRNAVSAFLASIKNLNDANLINYIAPGAKLNEIKIYKIGLMRLFFNFTKDNENKLSLAFLDLTFDVAPLNYPKNPIYNHNINPIYNHNINPIYNHNINPIYNHNINPRYNPNFEGYYFYNLNLTPLEFVINNDSFLFFYDFSNNLTKIGVYQSDQIYLVFDRENRHVAHLVSNGQGGFCYFENNNWRGSLH